MFGLLSGGRRSPKELVLLSKRKDFSLKLHKRLGNVGVDLLESVEIKGASLALRERTGGIGVDLLETTKIKHSPLKRHERPSGSSVEFGKA